MQGLRLRPHFDPGRGPAVREPVELGQCPIERVVLLGGDVAGEVERGACPERADAGVVERAQCPVGIPLAAGEGGLAVGGGGHARALQFQQREPSGSVGGLLVQRAAEASAYALAGVRHRDRDRAVGTEAARERREQVVVRVDEAGHNHAVGAVELLRRVARAIGAVDVAADRDDATVAHGHVSRTIDLAPLVHR